MSPLEDLQTYHNRGENSMNMQMGGHVGTRKSMSDEVKTVCVKCGELRTPSVFYYTHNAELVVSVCEPCSETYVYDRCVHCHQQAEITDLTEGPVYKHFDEVPAYFPSCDPCYDQGIKDVEREVREHVEDVTTTKTITREEFAKMSKPTPPVRVNESFYPTAPFLARYKLFTQDKWMIKDKRTQVVGYSPNLDVGGLEMQVLDTSGFVVPLSLVMHDTAKALGYDNYDYEIEVITSK